MAAEYEMNAGPGNSGGPWQDATFARSIALHLPLNKYSYCAESACSKESSGKNVMSGDATYQGRCYEG